MASGAPDVLQSDNRDLERVFNYMCKFSKKCMCVCFVKLVIGSGTRPCVCACLFLSLPVRYTNEIRKQKKILKEYRSHQQRSKGHEVMYDTLDPKAITSDMEAANVALDEAEQKIREINATGLDKISVSDLSLLLRDLGHPCTLVSICPQSKVCE